MQQFVIIFAVEVSVWDAHCGKEVLDKGLHDNDATCDSSVIAYIV